MDLPYATTYDCPPGGGIDITVEGRNFGPEVRIYIGGNECNKKSHDYGLDEADARIETVVCTIPAGEPARQENGICLDYSRRCQLSTAMPSRVVVAPLH